MLATGASSCAVQGHLQRAYDRPLHSTQPRAAGSAQLSAARPTSSSDAAASPSGERTGAAISRIQEEPGAEGTRSAGPRRRDCCVVCFAECRPAYG